MTRLEAIFAKYGINCEVDKMASNITLTFPEEEKVIMVTEWNVGAPELVAYEGEDLETDISLPEGMNELDEDQ